MKENNFEKAFCIEKELTNESLNNVLGGTACSKISVTISLAEATLAAEAEKKKDSDSDAESTSIQSQSLESKHSVNPVFSPSFFGATFARKKLCGISNRLKLSIPVTRVAV